MRHPFRRHRFDPPSVDPAGLEESKAALAEARAREIDVALSIDRTQRAARHNSFGPKFARAFREAHR